MPNCQPLPYVLAALEICIVFIKVTQARVNSPHPAKFWFSGRIFLPASSVGLDYCLDGMPWFSPSRWNRNSSCEGLLQCENLQHSWLWVSSGTFPSQCPMFYATQILLQAEVKQRMTFFLPPSYRRCWVECAGVADGPYPEQCAAVLNKSW